GCHATTYRSLASMICASCTKRRRKYSGKVSVVSASQAVYAKNSKEILVFCWVCSGILDRIPNSSVSVWKCGNACQLFRQRCKDREFKRRRRFMTMTPEAVLEFARKNGVRMVDFKF